MDEFRLTPHEIIEAYYGVDLDQSLAAHIASAPQEEVSGLFDFWTEHLDATELEVPELEGFQIRPIVSNTIEDRLFSGGAARSMRPIELAAPLLVYAHEVLVNDIWWHVCSPYPEQRLQACTWLIATRPLCEQGIIHFRELESPRRHPSRTGFNQNLVQELMSADLTPQEAALMDQLTTLAEQSDYWEVTDRQTLVSALLRDTAGDLSLALSKHPIEAHPLARSPLALRLMQMSAKSRRVPDGTNARLATLSQLSVPHLGTDYELLVRVRQNEELFADLRAALSKGLSEIDLSASPDADELARARIAVHQTCEPVIVKADKLVKETAGLSLLPKLFSTWSIAGVGAVAGAAISGGSATVGVVGGAIAKGVEFADEYHKARKKRDQGNSVQPLIAAFFPIEPRTSLTEPANR